MKKVKILILLFLIISIFSCTTPGGSFQVKSSESSSDIYIDGEYKGRGTAWDTTEENSAIPVRIETVDFDVLETEIEPEYLNDDEWLARHPEKIMTCSQTLTLALGLPGVSFLIAGLLLGDYGDAAKVNGLKLLGGVMTGATVPFIINWFTPKPYWKETYVFDISAFTHYDSDGYHKVTGFNKLGHNRLGEFVDGSSFNGRLVSGKKSGFGTWTTVKGTKHTGTFSNDKLNGFVLTEFTNGYNAYSRWVDGLINGVSVSYEYDGVPLAVYTGYIGNEAEISLKPYNTRITGSRYNWIFLPDLNSDDFSHYNFEGPAEGIADAVTEDLSVIVENGIYKNGRLTQGRMRFLDSGEVREGRFDGDTLVSGTIKQADGTSENGRFENGILVDGTKKYSNGSVYTGEFKAGLQHGNGKIVWRNGASYEGGFADNLPHGTGIYKSGDLVEHAEYYEGRRIDEAYLMRQYMEELRRENEREAERRKEEREAAEIAASEREYEAYVQSVLSSSDSSSNSGYKVLLDSLQDTSDTVTGGRTMEQMHDDYMSEFSSSSSGTSTGSSSGLHLSSSSSSGSNSSNNTPATYSRAWSEWRPFTEGLAIWQYRYMQIGENRFQVEVKTMGSLPSIRKDGLVVAAKTERVEVLFGRSEYRKTMEITEGEPGSISFTVDEDLSSSYAWKMRIVSRTQTGEKPLSKSNRKADGSVGSN